MNRTIAFRSMVAAAVTGGVLLATTDGDGDRQVPTGDERDLTPADHGMPTEIPVAWPGSSPCCQVGRGSHMGNTVSGVQTSSTIHLHMRRSGSMASCGPARVTEQA